MRAADGLPSVRPQSGRSAHEYALQQPTARSGHPNFFCGTVFSPAESTSGREVESEPARRHALDQLPPRLCRRRRRKSSVCIGRRGSSFDTRPAMRSQFSACAGLDAYRYFRSIRTPGRSTPGPGSSASPASAGRGSFAGVPSCAWPASALRTGRRTRRRYHRMDSGRATNWITFRDLVKSLPRHCWNRKRTHGGARC